MRRKIFWICPRGRNNSPAPSLNNCGNVHKKTGIGLDISNRGAATMESNKCWIICGQNAWYANTSNGPANAKIRKKNPPIAAPICLKGNGNLRDFNLNRMMPAIYVVLAKHAKRAKGSLKSHWAKKNVTEWTKSSTVFFEYSFVSMHINQDAFKIL